MALRKSDDITATPATIKPLSLRRKENGKVIEADTSKRPTEAEVDIDLREVYLLIMHFLSAGPCHETFGHFWKELVEHQLLPRRYHAWYSRSGVPSGDENDDGISFPLSYSTLLQRYPNVGKDHLVKLLKQLLLGAPAPLSRGLTGGIISNASTVPTLLGTGSFSVLSSDHGRTDNDHRRPPSYMRWPHRLANQVRGLSLRELGGGFSRHHRAPSIRAACYAIAKPSTMVQKMQNVKSVRGHRNSVYCATFDQSGRYVITGSDDRLVKIWSMETAYCLASCRGHEGDITDLAVNFNNTVVASAANDCVIRVWRLPDGMPISILRGHTGVVTAIEFSPRPGAVYQLLSSSDDGTCRLWDARYSHFAPRIYVPKPSDAAAVRSSAPSSITIQPNLQIFCCTFNASGTVFVTGSSDTLARVWSACKSSVDDSDQPNHEIDTLSGHENDVNYVQFSGCSVNTRFLSTEGIKEDSPKFKTTWFNHDNIVTCSRDGSAIIWIPRSRRSHGKTGRWVRAYHLKVPPPPMAPQPSRGGPRQRVLPTPRGVNMITWSLDNRFVLAAIMDCRICVWNAIDGSLVHSLTGHTDSTYVLDVHPFNPRIAMSAGYDGKTIIWDIWEGTPIRTFVIGPFKLVDGKFSPDGTSIILSDDVGQLYILSTGQGESHRDAKFDQFFLGDYRPLVQDAHGNVLDQETQLVPYRRNMQDLLCDSGMIPYPEPYQSMFQRRRLGALGIEWRPSSVKFAVGVDFNLDPNYQMPPIVDLDNLIDPLPEFVDVMDWEPEIVIHSDDNDSEYRIADDSLSGAEQLSLCSDSGEPECSENSDVESEDTERDLHRRLKRKKLKADVMTSFGRRVKRRNLDVQDESVIRTNHSRKSRNGPKGFKKKSSSKSRPRRAAARNALHLFTRISTDGEEEEASDGDTSESGSTLPEESSFETEESDESLPKEWCERPEGKEIFFDRHVDDVRRQPVPESYSNASSKGRIILKLPYRNSNKVALQQSSELKCEVNGSDIAGPSSRTPQKAFKTYETFLEAEEQSTSRAGDGGNEQCSKSSQPEVSEPHVDLLGGLRCGPTTWGGFKARTSKRLKVGEPTVAGSDSFLDQNVKTESTMNGHSIYLEQEGTCSPTSGIQSGRTGVSESLKNGEGDGELRGLGNSGLVYNNNDAGNGSVAPSEICINGIENNMQLEEKSKEISVRTPQKLRIKSLTLSRDGSTSKSAPEHVEEEKNGVEHTSDPRIHAHDDNTVGEPGKDGPANGCSSTSQLEEPPKSDSNRRMFTAVYQRSRFSRNKNNPEYGRGNMEASTSSARPCNLNGEIDTPPEGFRRARSIRFKSSARDLNASVSNFRFKEPHDDSKATSSDADKASPSVGEENSSEDLKPISRSSILLRSTRAKNYVRNASPPRKSSQTGKTNWLLMSVLDEGYRYVPQKGDEVAYLRQGHQEYLNDTNSRFNGPWETFKRSTIRAVEFCRVEILEYSTHPGSGESCCKLTLKFSDPSSAVFGKSFKLTLPEVTSFPEFLVEKSRYEASIARNWTTRDKCQVWWKNEGVEDGSWWEGRILTVKPKSPEFPDSPWERFAVKYKSNPTETHHHSPWELHDADSHWEQPHIDEEKKEKLTRAFPQLEQSGNSGQDYYGVRKLRQVSEKANFTNRFPVPLSLEVIQSRLENSYYRSMEALEHDVEVMLSNAESFFGRNVEMSKKVKCLSDWFQRTLSSL